MRKPVGPRKLINWFISVDKYIHCVIVESVPCIRYSMFGRRLFALTRTQHFAYARAQLTHIQWVLVTGSAHIYDWLHPTSLVPHSTDTLFEIKSRFIIRMSYTCLPTTRAPDESICKCLCYNLNNTRRPIQHTYAPRLDVKWTTHAAEEVLAAFLHSSPPGPVSDTGIEIQLRLRWPCVKISPNIDKH